MTNLSDFVRRLVDVLEGLGLPYMFVGSAASTLHGPPRSTQDIDLVVALTLKDAPRLLAAFPDDGYYVSAEAVRDAVLRRYSFNIIDLESGWKADIMGSKHDRSAGSSSSADSALTFLVRPHGSRPRRIQYSPSLSGRSLQVARLVNVTTYLA